MVVPRRGSRSPSNRGLDAEPSETLHKDRDVACLHLASQPVQVCLVARGRQSNERDIEWLAADSAADKRAGVLPSRYGCETRERCTGEHPPCASKNAAEAVAARLVEVVVAALCRLEHHARILASQHDACATGRPDCALF
jgi:hypothetical protein